MKRRQFLAGLAALSVARAHAQAPSRTGKPLPRVGIYLTSPLRNLERDYVSPFQNGMRELGWVGGQTVDYDLAEAPRDLQAGDRNEMIDIARSLVARRPNVIWLSSSLSATPLVHVTRNDANGKPIPLVNQIPVVGAAVSEVVERGLAESLARPGLNFSGMSNFAWELGGQRFQLLNEIMPKLTRVGVLMHPKNPNCLRDLKEIEEAAALKRVTVIPAMMEREDEAGPAFAELAKNRAEAVLITHLPLFQNYRKSILKLAAEQRIPAVGHRPFFAEEGALLAYSTDLKEQMRRSAHIVDKILKGTRPGVIPIEQPTIFELIINRRTAQTFGLTIPYSMEHYRKARII